MKPTHTFVTLLVLPWGIVSTVAHSATAPVENETLDFDAALDPSKTQSLVGRVVSVRPVNDDKIVVTIEPTFIQLVTNLVGFTRVS